MPSITAEGNYNVTVKEGRVVEFEKETDPGAFAVNMLFETPDELSIWGSLNFSHTIISKGKNAGKTVAQVSNETLLDLGVKDGYIGNLKSAIDAGLEANIAVKWDNYDPDHPRLKVAFINAPRGNESTLEETDFEAIMAKFNGTASPQHEAPAVPTVPPPPTDDKGFINAPTANPNEPQPF